MSAKTINYVKWCICALAGIIMWVIPETDFYTLDVKKFAVITIVAVLMIAFEVLPLIIPGMILMFGYYLSGLFP